MAAFNSRFQLFFFHWPICPHSKVSKCIIVNVVIHECSILMFTSKSNGTIFGRPQLKVMSQASHQWCQHYYCEWFHSFSYFGMLNVENLTSPKIYGCWQITKSVGSAFNTFNASYNTYILHTSYNTFMQCHHSVSTSWSTASLVGSSGQD